MAEPTPIQVGDDVGPDIYPAAPVLPAPGVDADRFKENPGLNS